MNNSITIKDIKPRVNGVAFYFSNGVVITRFRNKNIQTQGEEVDVEVQKELEEFVKEIFVNPPKVFIDYAFSNKDKMDEVKKLLECWGLVPLVMEDMTNGTQSLLSKLEGTLYQADYGLVLLSADDQLIDGKYLPRQNVMLELGMLLSHLKDKGDKRLTLINYDSDKLEIPSDIFGLAYTPYKVETFEQELFKELSHLYPKFD